MYIYYLRSLTRNWLTARKPVNKTISNRNELAQVHLDFFRCFILSRANKGHFFNLFVIFYISFYLRKKSVIMSSFYTNTVYTHTLLFITHSSIPVYSTWYCSYIKNSRSCVCVCLGTTCCLHYCTRQRYNS